MHKHNDNNFSISRQATERAASILSDNEIEMLHRYLDLQRDNPGASNEWMIEHYFLMLRDLTTDDEFVRLKAIFDEVFSIVGGAS